MLRLFKQRRLSIPNHHYYNRHLDLVVPLELPLHLAYTTRTRQARRGVVRRAVERDRASSGKEYVKLAAFAELAAFAGKSPDGFNGFVPETTDTSSTSSDGGM